LIDVIDITREWLLGIPQDLRSLHICSPNPFPNELVQHIPRKLVELDIPGSKLGDQAVPHLPESLKICAYLR